MANRYPGVFKRGDVWYIRYDLPKGLDGKRRPRMIACKGMNQHQADQLRRQKLTEIYNGTYIDPDATSLAQYMVGWLERMRDQVAPTTHESYTRDVHRHIIPAAGDVRMSKLSPLHIQELYDGLRKRKLSPKTVRNIHGILHGALAQAVRLRLLHVNPADAVELPRVRRHEMRTATPEEIAKLINALDGRTHRIPILIAIATGMRRGEILGLKWSDFDADRRTLTVRRALAYANKRVILKDTKTGRARVVLVPPSLADILEEHREEQRQRAKFLREKYARGDWICTHEDGRVITPKSMSTAFSRLMDTLSINCTFHGLRHTQATSLILAGVPVKVVSERLGHANVGITQDIYTHVLPHNQETAAEYIERSISLRPTKKEASEG